MQIAGFVDYALAIYSTNAADDTRLCFSSRIFIAAGIRRSIIEIDAKRAAAGLSA